MFRPKFLVKKKKKKKKKLASTGFLIQFFFPRKEELRTMLSAANVPADSLVLTIGSDNLSTPLEKAPLPCKYLDTTEAVFSFIVGFKGFGGMLRQL